MKTTANIFYSQASEKLKEANEEYSRSVEDIVWSAKIHNMLLKTF